MRKNIITLLFAVGLSVIPCHTTDAGIIDIIQNVGNKLKNAAQAARYASSIAAISGYPSQYVRVSNAIIDDLNEIKRLCAQSNLARADQKFVLDMMAGFLNNLSTTIDDFCVTVESASVLKLIGNDNKDGGIDKTIVEIRDRHNLNMRNLNSFRHSVAQLKNLLLATHAGNSLIDKMKTARQNGY